MCVPGATTVPPPSTYNAQRKYETFRLHIPKFRKSNPWNVIVLQFSPQKKRRTMGSIIVTDTPSDMEQQTDYHLPVENMKHCDPRHAPPLGCDQQDSTSR